MEAACEPAGTAHARPLRVGMRLCALKVSPLSLLVSVGQLASWFLALVSGALIKLAE